MLKHIDFTALQSVPCHIKSREYLYLVLLFVLQSPNREEWPLTKTASHKGAIHRNKHVRLRWRSWVSARRELQMQITVGNQMCSSNLSKSPHQLCHFRLTIKVSGLAVTARPGGNGYMCRWHRTRSLASSQNFVVKSLQGLNLLPRAITTTVACAH